MANIIYYDLETTGTDVCRDQIVEIAGYRENTNTYYHKLIKSMVPISEEASKVNKITNEDLKNKQSFNQIVCDFEDFIDFNNPFNVSYMISHNNNNFDKIVLKAEYKRINRKLPNIVFIDTLPITRCLYPELPNYKLGTLMKNMNIISSNQHEALDDVNSLYIVYNNCRKIKSDKELFEISKTYILNKMPFGKYKNDYIKDIPESYVNWLKNNIFNNSRNKDLIKGFKKYNPHY